MSLLMQALKKAEQIKKKQSGMAPDEALTLSPKELAVTTEIVDIVEVTEVTEFAREKNKLESPGSPLTLSPHMEEKPAELASVEPDLTLDVVSGVVSSPIISPVTALQENVVQHNAIVPTSFDVGAIENRTASDTVSAKSVSAELGEAEQKNISRPEMPKIGAEQKKMAEQAEKILLSEQNKAKSVFSAKAPQRNQSNQRRTRIGIYASLSLLVAAAIAYFYWQSMNVGLNSTLLRTPLQLPITPATPATPAIDAGATASQALATIASQTSAMNALLEASDSADATTVAQKNPAPQLNPVPVSSELKFRPNVVNTAAEPVATETASATSAKIKRIPATPIEDSNAIQIRRNSSGNQVNPALVSAYQYFISGDADAAKMQYQKVLQQEPNNRDALLGMAAIALNQRQAEQAGSFYGRLLELDPADPDAIAGLTSLQQGDPVQSESRLKKSLSQNPQAGAVLFALGNLYAQQSRWSDAQQTYFRAYTTTPGSADYAFNLAVSLDKLNQMKLAREYYQRALTLGQNSAGNFSRSDVQKRVAELDAIAQE